jgi:hypothetical protein
MSESAAPALSEFTFFYIAEGNSRFTVELDLWAQLICVSDGMDVWRNATALLHAPTKQRLSTALRQGRVTIQKTIINPPDTASTLDLFLRTAGDKLSCEYVSTTECPFILQQMFFRMSQELSTTHSELQRFRNPHLLDSPMAQTSGSVFPKMKMAKSRPGMSAINPHARKRKPATGFKYEDSDSD